MDDFIKTEAIVLDYKGYGEKSVILNVFSKEKGIINIFIKDITKMHYTVEANILSISQFLLRKSANFYYIQDVDLVYSNFALRSSYQKQVYSLIMTDLIKTIFYDDIAENKVYELIKKSAIFMGKDDKSIHILNAFILKLDSYLGYMPNLNFKNNNYFSYESGFTNVQSEDNVFIDELHAKYLVFLAKNVFEDILIPEYKNINSKKILEILLKYTMNNFGLSYLGSLNYIEYL
ncbi:MAG: DNA repair protein RecO [Finegoldia sp.]|nr:DNA repair protein RecO [Finegoldia sp.]